MNMRIDSRRKRLTLVLMVAAALGSTSATMGGALAVLAAQHSAGAQAYHLA